MIVSDQSTSLIKAENIEKTYGKKMVVRGVSYELKQGEVVGLL